MRRTVRALELRVGRVGRGRGGDGARDRSRPDAARRPRGSAVALHAEGGRPADERAGRAAASAHPARSARQDADARADGSRAPRQAVRLRSVRPDLPEPRRFARLLSALRRRRASRFLPRDLFPGAVVMSEHAQGTRQDRRDQGRRHRRGLPGRAARDLQRARDPDADRRRRHPDADRGGAAAPGRRPRARGRDGLDRRPRARDRRRRHRRADLGPGRRRDARPHLERDRRADRQRGAGRQGRRALVDPPRSAGVPRPVADGRDLRDRHQGHRPDRPVHQGRQGRPLRRRRRGQDGPDPGADPQRRPRSTAASRSSPASASAPARATTSCSRWRSPA